MYNCHQWLVLASAGFYQDRFHWVSIGYRENNGPQLPKSTLN